MVEYRKVQHLIWLSTEKYSFVFGRVQQSITFCIGEYRKRTTFYIGDHREITFQETVKQKKTMYVYVYL